jgi:hypothetical protein
VWLVLGLAVAAGSCAANTILGGLEDWGGSAGAERNGDFNDLMFQMTGSVAFNAPGGIFNNLTAGVVNENGTVFWGNFSGDGANLNIGYQMLKLGSLQYLSTASGGSVNDVTFSAEGPLTITILGGITANMTGDTLGWYDPANPSVVHPLFNGITAGAMVTFAPTATFAFYADNGWNQGFSSTTADNDGESTTQQHFAFFTPQSSNVPEPSPVLLAGIGLALLAIGSAHLRKR